MRTFLGAVCASTAFNQLSLDFEKQVSGEVRSLSFYWKSICFPFLFILIIVPRISLII